MSNTIAISTNTAPEAGEISEGKLLSGNAAIKLWHAFSDQSDRFHVGHWASEECSYSVNFTENELCVIVEGSVSLTSEDGTVAVYNAGDAFVVPAGFKGTWTSKGSVKKIYASFE